jgi:hypothetical protein
MGVKGLFLFNKVQKDQNSFLIQIGNKEFYILLKNLEDAYIEK